jgi:CDP-glycerol glycerophosphotransferase (TagB/SpsB family)
MVLSYYIYKYPYRLFWYLAKVLKKNEEMIFYCADPIDYEMFLPIKKFLPEITIIAKNKKSRKYLALRNIKYKRLPSFPKVVIMGRQTPYKFPVDRIIKIGFDHGLYQFKRWTSAKNYNGFDVYFVSSDEQVKTAFSRGINSVKAIGYPKLDPAFNGAYDKEFLEKFKIKIGIDKKKKTLIFTTTWNVAGLSAIEKWIDEIESLSDTYNILVTVHTWTKKVYIDKLRSLNKIFFIEDYNVTPYLMIADLLVGDYSSIIGEFCAFDKPIVTFKVPNSDRTISEIQLLLKSISKQVENFEELEKEIIASLKNPEEKKREREEANKVLFYKLDGQAGKRAADEIKRILDK